MYSIGTVKGSKEERKRFIVLPRGLFFITAIILTLVLETKQLHI